MSVYNPNDPRDYLRIMDFIRKAKDCRFYIEMRKFHPQHTDRQQRYLQFMLSYYAMRNGETFFSVLHSLRTEICPASFRTGCTDANGREVFKPLSAITTAEASSVIRNFIDFAAANGTAIPEPDDKSGIEFCRRELESSGAGWV